MESTNGNFVQRHAEAVSLLHDVEVLHCIGDQNQQQHYLFDEKIINGIRTLIVYYQKTKNPVLNYFRRMKAYKQGFSKMAFPNVVHANILQNSMLFAVYLKKKHKLPFVVSEHWSGLLKINRSKVSGSKIKIAKFIANQAEYILPVSKMLMLELQSSGIGKRFEVVENVVNTEVFKLRENQSTGTFRFLHISNLIALKNPEPIIHAAIKLHQEFPNFELSIGGDGDIEPLKKIVQENNAERYISVFGEQTLEQVAEKMQYSDCFILFSDYENLPCVLLESMSCGVPVIATQVGGIPEIVHPKMGILIHKQPEELYQAMKKVVSKKTEFCNPEEMHQYIQENFCQIKIAEKFDRIYQKILNFEK